MVAIAANAPLITPANVDRLCGPENARAVVIDGQTRLLNFRPPKAQYGLCRSARARLSCCHASRSASGCSKGSGEILAPDRLGDVLCQGSNGLILPRLRHRQRDGRRVRAGWLVLLCPPRFMDR